MDDFYIGYLPKAPDNLKGWLIKVIAGLFLVGLLLLMTFLFNYETSPNSTFEYGIYKELTGQIYSDPVPVIRVSSENSSKNIVLVNFGKVGVSGILGQLEDSLSGNLEDYDVTLRGSLIYYDGITLFELSDDENSVIDVKASTKKTVRSNIDLGKVTLTGELVDSKCFFGVMKPAYGKIHRSCATRCIEGGIPVALSTNKLEYYFVGGEDILKFSQLIGKEVEIDAQAFQIDNLKYLNFQDIRRAENSSNNGPILIKLAGMALKMDRNIGTCEVLVD